MEKLIFHLNLYYKSTFLHSVFTIFTKHILTKRETNDANETINELEDKVSELQKMVDYFKELWEKFIKFLNGII